MTTPSARVRRNGNTVMVPAEKLVPGDVVLLEAGNLVPADLGLIDLEIGAVAALFAMEEYCCDPIGSLQVSSVFLDFLAHEAKCVKMAEAFINTI